MVPVFLPLLIVPLIEVALFVLVGGWIGAVPTVALVVLTALIGTALIRRQGLATLARAEREMTQGRAPVQPMLDGVCLLVGALLLVTPGFLTDVLGLLLMVPAGRGALGRWVWRGLERRRAWRHRQAGFPSGPGPTGQAGDQGPHPRRTTVVIESEYRDLDKS